MARWAEVTGRNSSAPWLDARLEPAAGGGARLTGTSGLHPDVRVFRRVSAAVGGLMAAASLAGGIRLLVLGDLGGLGPAVLFPLLVAALVAGTEVACRRLPARRSGELIREISKVLGSAAADTGPAGGNSA